MDKTQLNFYTFSASSLHDKTEIFTYSFDESSKINVGEYCIKQINKLIPEINYLSGKITIFNFPII